MAHIARRPTIHGDKGRAVTVALPPTYEALADLVMSSFRMHAPLKLYLNGKVLLSADTYASISQGDSILGVDCGGNAVDMTDFFKTTYAQNYGPKPLPPREAREDTSPYQPLKDNRDFGTTNGDFKRWAIPKKTEYMPPPVPKRLPFHGRTEAQDQFQQKSLPPAAEPEPEKYERPRIPFTGTTTNQDAFKKWPIKQREQMQPSRERKTCPFTARTSNQDDYRPYKIEPKQATEQEQWAPSPAKFQGVPTSRDYQAWPIEKKQEPETVERPRSLPFTGRTTNQDDFKPYDIKPRDTGEPEEAYSPHKDNRDFRPTSRDYQAWPIPKKEMFAPEETPKSLPFTARSSNQDDYRPYDIKPRDTGEPEEAYAPLKDNRDFVPTSRDYQAWPIAKKETFAPEESPKSLPFTARSSNQDDYRPYDIKPEKRSEAEPYRGSNIPFTATTTNHDDFKRWAIPKKIYVSLVPANDAFLDKTGHIAGSFLTKSKNSSA